MSRQFTISELHAIANGTARYTTLNAYARMFTHNDRKAAVGFAKARLAEYESIAEQMRANGMIEVEPGIWVDDDECGESSLSIVQADGA